MRPFAVFWTALALAAGLCACGPADNAKPATLVVGVPAEPDSFNVYLARSSASLLLADLALPRLAKEVLPDGVHEGGLFPSLATSWELSGDGRELTFHLDPTRRWSSGSPVTCEDLRFTLEAQTSPALAWRGASIKRHIVELNCPDPQTAVYVFDHGYPGQVMDANDLHVLSRELRGIPFEQWRETDWPRRMIWGGPFRVESAVAGQQIDLVRLGPAEDGAIERLVIRIVPDSAARFDQLLTGDLDLVDGLTPEQLARAGREPSVSVVRRPGSVYTYLGWNTIDPAAYGEYRERRQRGCDARGEKSCPDDAAEVAALARRRPHPLFGDARVRRAMTLAIDRQTLVDTLYLGEASVPASPLLDPLAEHDPALAPLPYDVEAARALLEQAGFADADGDGVIERGGVPFSFGIAVQAGRAERLRAAELIVTQLAEVGVQAEIERLESSSFYPRLGGHQADAWIGGWRTSLRVDMSEMLHADACGTGGANFGCWSDPRADPLATAAREEIDDAARVAGWRAWERVFAEEQPYTMLFAATRLTGVNRRVEGAEESILAGDPLAGVEHWTLREE